ncbi:hypothetical protein [Nitrosomonas supralitoralis]|uniref:Uncharacterized protein n=1 Tax=Nitrosomonas supralitoralis TaxID=2116706 RepID=A0A2P7NR06_9PROT|nr:hypothetical protein [Nitrosomonas supralitoralis]PSJ15902.1 hypothetical protein C7H79_16465 [Nitrosomonas supralitoralis]
MKNKEHIDSKEDNFVKSNTTPIVPTPEELSFEVELLKNSPGSNKNPEEIPMKHPDNEEPA